MSAYELNSQPVEAYRRNMAMARWRLIDGYSAPSEVVNCIKNALGHANRLPAGMAKRQAQAAALRALNAARLIAAA